MKHRLIIVGIFVCLYSIESIGQTITITADINWSDLSPVPGATADLLVKNGATVTVDVNNAVANRVSLGVGAANAGTGTLRFNAGSVLTLSGTDGTLSLGLSSSYKGTLDMTAGGSVFVKNLTGNNGALIHGAGLIEVNGTSTLHFQISDFNNLNINISGGTVTLGRSITVNGNLNVMSGTLTTSASNYALTVNGNTTNSGTLIANNSIINFKGNFSNSSTFTPVGSTVTFSGTTAQSITGATTFNNFTLNNTLPGNALTLNNPMTVNGNLTLTEGHLITTTTNLLTVGASATVTLNGSPQGNSFVKGPVAKIGSANFTFPVGKDAKYRPIAITSLSGSDTFTAEYFHSDPNLVPYGVNSKDVTLDHIGRCEYWILNRAAAVNAFVTLRWDSYSCGVDNLNDLAVARWDGAVWRDHGNGGTTGAIDVGTVISSAIVTSFSPFTLASTSINNPLPIKLHSFTANCNSQTGILHWSTSSEINNDYFTLERSKNGTNWEIAGTVDGAGNSSSIRYYSFTDDEQNYGVSYYRLKQTDFDGKYEYSHVIPAKNCRGDDLSEVMIYPNPNKGIFTIKGSENKDELIITNIFGEKLFSQENQSEKSEIDLSGQPNGIYLLHIKSENGASLKKIIINKD